MFHLATITLLALLAIPSVWAACGNPSVGEFPDYYCTVCGYRSLVVGLAPYECDPRNATFDDVALGPLSTHNSLYFGDQYRFTNWTDVDVVNATHLPLVPHISPYSAPAFAKIAASKTGVLSWGHEEDGLNVVLGDTAAGGLYSMHYACTLPLLNTPQSCKITVTSYCTNAASNTISRQNATLEYKASLGNSTMAYAEQFVHGLFPPNGYPQGYCTNTSISAVSDSGLPVDLYIDDVILFAIRRVH